MKPFFLRQYQIQVSFFLEVKAFLLTCWLAMPCIFLRNLLVSFRTTYTWLQLQALERAFYYQSFSQALELDQLCIVTLLLLCFYAFLQSLLGPNQLKYHTDFRFADKISIILHAKSKSMILMLLLMQLSFRAESFGLFSLKS